MSRARSSSHFDPQMTLITFQPAPRNMASASWMILPLPRTGPSRRWRLQLTTKIRLSRCSRPATPEGADRLHLVELAVTEEGPDAVGGGVDDLALEEVAGRVGLVDGAERAEAHRDGGVLPEVGEEAGMGVARQAPARDLLAEVVELVLGEPALDEGAGVDAGRGVALEVDEVAEAAVGLAAEEVVEADLVERGRAGVGGEVAADALGAVVGAAHHGRRVPADVGADAALDVFVAGEPGLLVLGDGVHVGGGDRGGEVDLLGPGALEELHEQEAGPGPSLGVDDGVEGVDPLRGLLGVDVGKLMRHSVEEHCSMLRAASW